MRLYRPNAASNVRLAFGVELSEGLSFFEKTKAHAAALDAVQAPLAEAAEATRQARTPLPKLRAARRFGEYGVEQALRRAQLVCKDVDGGRAGAVSGVVFPNGLDPEVTPKGAAQLEAAKDLRARVENGALAELQPAKEKLFALLDPAIQAFEQALAALDSATAVVDRARAIEVSRRDDHRRTVDAIFGHVRAAYPGDRAIHAVIAPVVDERGRGGEGDDGDDGDEGDDGSGDET